MNDEGLERDLRAALVTDEPGRVPDELRERVTAIPGEVPISPVARRRFPRMLMSVEPLVGIAAAAIILALVIGLRPSGSTPGSSASILPSAPSTASAASSSAPGVVPWVNRSATPSEPAPTPPPGAFARPCGPSDLHVSVGRVGQAMGNLNLPVTLVNRSTTACSLSGYPSLSGVSSTGASVPLRVAHGSYFGDPGSAGNLKPGGVGGLNIGGGAECAAARNGVNRTYPVLRIGLPAGGTVDIPAAFDTSCVVDVSALGAIPLTNPTEPPVSPLQAEISAPATVEQGAVLAYVVALHNTGATAYPLEPCPDFEQALGTGSSAGWVATITYGLLNCDAVHEVPAGGTVSYEMRLAVPIDQPTGDAKFTWLLLGDSGPLANAPMQVVRRP